VEQDDVLASLEAVQEFRPERLLQVADGELVGLFLGQVAGTGAGKTEAFLLPILNGILDEPYRGAQALLLYRVAFQ